MPDIDKLDLQSKNITEEQKAKFRELFPEVFTEDKIDFKKLRLTLGDDVDHGEERFGMTWPGKRDCFKIIQEPSIATLKPCKEESVNWDETKNLFIEGDNLEVLKQLQKSYYGKIKMIYIDPPYNTGNQFIYPDDYSESIETYLAYTGQIDDEGRKFSTNTEADGRFHSKWLNMMYPRLFLARNLLRNDGVVFISINENEHENLIKLCNEIFGEDNFIADISVVSNWKGRSDDKYVATAHEYLLFYKKSDFVTFGLPLPEEYLEKYQERDSEGNPMRLLGLRKRGAGARREDRPNMFYPFYVNPSDKTVSLEKTETHSIKVIPKLSDGTDGRWRWGKDSAQSRLEEIAARTVSSSNRWDIFQIDRAFVNGALRRIKPKSVWTEKSFSNEAGGLTFKKIMGVKAFENPKPVELIKCCLQQATQKDDLVLDFFAGSCTTAHAVVELNKEDNGNRNFIMVQLPEICNEKTEAHKAGYNTIADIGKERIQRVIKKVREEFDNEDPISLQKSDIDLGCKVFKLDKSNFKIWDGDFEDKPIQEQLELAIDHIDPNSSEEDILYEILLKSGFELTTPIEELTLEGKNVYSVAEGALLICLEKKLTNEVMRAIAEREPHRVVCLDTGFKGNDQLKTNAVQIMKSFNVESFRTV